MDAKDEEGIHADRCGCCVFRWRLSSIENNIPFNFVPWAREADVAANGVPNVQ
jgi:hypothetical protein